MQRWGTQRATVDYPEWLPMINRILCVFVALWWVVILNSMNLVLFKHCIVLFTSCFCPWSSSVSGVLHFCCHQISWIMRLLNYCLKWNTLRESKVDHKMIAFRIDLHDHWSKKTLVCVYKLEPFLENCCLTIPPVKWILDRTNILFLAPLQTSNTHKSNFNSFSKLKTDRCPPTNVVRVLQAVWIYVIISLMSNTCTVYRLHSTNPRNAKQQCCASGFTPCHHHHHHHHHHHRLLLWHFQ